MLATGHGSSSTTRKAGPCGPALGSCAAPTATVGASGQMSEWRKNSYGCGRLHHHVGTGRFERLFPGVYRMCNAPVAPHDDLLLAWVWSNYRATISHESALALYGLSDVMPSRVQLTVPPSFGRSSSPFAVHRSPLAEDDVTIYDGVP